MAHVHFPHAKISCCLRRGEFGICSDPDSAIAEEVLCYRRSQALEYLLVVLKEGAGRAALEALHPNGARLKAAYTGGRLQVAMVTVAGLTLPCLARKCPRLPWTKDGRLARMHSHGPFHFCMSGTLNCTTSCVVGSLYSKCFSQSIQLSCMGCCIARCTALDL